LPSAENPEHVLLHNINQFQMKNIIMTTAATALLSATVLAQTDNTGQPIVQDWK